MVSEKAKRAYRRALERLYEDRCSIYSFEKKKNPDTGITEYLEKTEYSDIPCRLSFKTLSAATQTDSQAIVAQETKLFIAPEIEVRENSKIVISKSGVELVYKNSGVPAKYLSHQEIVLENYKERS